MGLNIYGKLAAIQRELKAPKGQDTRPTADRIKESLFNILGTRVLEQEVLDIFAGTGNLGLEALSRGAALAVLVEKDRLALAAIRANRDKTHLEEGCRILPMDVARALQILRSEGQTFDIVFLDPPYEKDLVSLTLGYIYERKLIKEEGIIIAEHSRHEQVKEEFRDKIIKTKAGKITSFTLLSA